MEFFATSGAKVVINPASFAEARKLLREIERVAAAGTLPTVDMPVTELAANFLRIDSSEAVEAALWPCLLHCIRDKQKITETTFDDIKARADFYDIALACAKVNLDPLVQSLFSKWSALVPPSEKQANDLPASESMTKPSLSQ